MVTHSSGGLFKYEMYIRLIKQKLATPPSFTTLLAFYDMLLAVHSKYSVYFVLLKHFNQILIVVEIQIHIFSNEEGMRKHTIKK